MDEPKQKKAKAIVFDGVSYVFPHYDQLTFREHKTIRDVAGVLPNDIEAALEGADPMVIFAFLVIAKRRAGESMTPPEIEKLLDRKLFDMDVEFEDEPEQKTDEGPFPERADEPE